MVVQLLKFWASALKTASSNPSAVNLSQLAPWARHFTHSCSVVSCLNSKSFQIKKKRQPNESMWNLVSIQIGHFVTWKLEMFENPFRFTFKRNFPGACRIPKAIIPLHSLLISLCLAITVQAIELDVQMAWEEFCLPQMSLSNVLLAGS